MGVLIWAGRAIGKDQQLQGIIFLNNRASQFLCMKSSFHQRWHLKKKKSFVLVFIGFLGICILHAVLNTRDAALHLCRHHYIILEGRGMITLIFHI